MRKPICFVIQPFDEGNDKRFEDTIKPAIEAAGLKPYRVDKDPTAQVPIASIEEHIRNAKVCLADITTNNPNVWYEVGFAFASETHVLLICENRRERFPFDIQHRNVLRYDTSSKTDFNKLGREITERCKALPAVQPTVRVDRPERDRSDLSPLTDTEELVLRTIAGRASPGDYVAVEHLFSDSSTSRPSSIDLNISLSGLAELKYVVIEMRVDEEGWSHMAVRIIDEGWSWLRQNLHGRQNQPAVEDAVGDEDDPVPF